MIGRGVGPGGNLKDEFLEPVEKQITANNTAAQSRQINTGSEIKEIKKDIFL